MAFAHITLESDVQLDTGFERAKMFSLVFEYVKHKAKVMVYWDGSKRIFRNRKRSFSVEAAANFSSLPEVNIDETVFPLKKTGPGRKLDLEQKFLLVMMMRLRLGLLIEDLAFQFCISADKVS